ncbi:ATP-grasp domain-containing protein [Mariniblastus fucicola]|uniref:Carbamoyl phosphate synthase-like protein n=1 Tax=Mariniblastus fucicola TaxID=980251 RepID=A0A5B9PDT2_9BACT|nr:ATP-grasp domain-containing protein [Mariniblastus fucicola]QEG21103.1 carbamoyl phosphate synthase-like protein [Mariniblastus fucicola]
MKVLVFEFMVGGGVADQHPFDAELQVFFRQGHGMLRAVCEDLLSLGHQVIVPVDVQAEAELPDDVERVDVERESDVDSVLLAAASEADRILLIAPETDGCLERLANLLNDFAHKFIGPDVGLIRLAADKWKCHQWYVQHKVPCPDSILLTDEGVDPQLPMEFFPCVVKPVDGAGSEGVRLISSMSELAVVARPLLMQKFVVGAPVSVSVIVESSEAVHFLEPGRQIFDSDPFGVHLRTQYPLESGLRERALSLARHVVETSPQFVGYVGIDMVLAEDAASDVLIEINPRLTTSYCFLREWSKQNLAEKFPSLESR